MLCYNDIIKEENKDLRKKSADVKMPLSEEDINTLNQINDYLVKGYEDDAFKKYNIRPGVGLAAVQIGVLKKMFVILLIDEKGVEYHFGVINPKILSTSEELTYLSGGEGCLSVDRSVTGLIHRPKRIKVHFYCYDFEKKEGYEVTTKFKNYISIVFQHEYDHLSGILFIDKINKENPMFVPENSSPIVFEDLEKDENK